MSENMTASDAVVNIVFTPIWFSVVAWAAWFCGRFAFETGHFVLGTLFALLWLYLVFIIATCLYALVLLFLYGLGFRAK